MNKVALLIGILLMPAITSAGGTGTLQSFIAVVGNIINMLLSIAATFSIVVFFYGLAIFIFNAGDEKKREEGKSILIWGVVALFVLVTIWGIIGLLQKTVGNTQGPGRVNIVLPQL